MTAAATIEEVKFVDFDDEFQAKIVAMLVRDSTFARRTEGLIKPSYFDSRAHGFIANIALAYFGKYKRAISEPHVVNMMLTGAKRAGKIRDDVLEECELALPDIFTTDISSRDFVIDQVGEFARHQAIQAAVLSGIELLEKHETGRFEELMLKAMQVKPHADSTPYDYWSEIESRTQFRTDVKTGKIAPNGLSTGIKGLDAVLYHKGWGKRELTVFMAGAKKGKSFTIWDFGKLQTLQGRNVLGITLEVSKEILSDRLDASVADQLIDELNDHILDVHKSVSAMKGKVGKFMLHEYPTGTFTPNELESLIEMYKAQGIVFDCIVIDYLDIMAPNRWTNDEIANSKSVWVDTRAIAQREDLPIISATQTNREGHKSVTSKADQVAEDFNKVRIADLLISINATEEEIAKGEARMFFAASRNQKGEFSIRIKRDLSRGHAFKEVLGYE